MANALFLFDKQDSPEAGVLYLLRGLLNVLQDYTWDANSDARAIAYTRVLAALSAFSQEDYPYHVDQGDRVSAFCRKGFHNTHTGKLTVKAVLTTRLIKVKSFCLLSERL